MTELQVKLLGILEWFNCFCEENGLRYYLIGGTMLGAARHNGFIPWDDDIDVGMPRADYNRMAQILKNKKNEKYILETPETDADDFFYASAKIYDTSTTLIENTRYKIKRGIFLDVFPLDGIGNSLQESINNYKKITYISDLLHSRVCAIRKGRSFFKNLSIVLMRCVPNIFINNKKLLKQLVNTCSKYSFDDCLWVGNLVGAWRFKEVMPKEIIGEPTDYMFEGIKVKGVADADKYLTHIYGNWRELPPIEKQVTHHDFILLDINKSYLE